MSKLVFKAFTTALSLLLVCGLAACQSGLSEPNIAVFGSETSAETAVPSHSLSRAFEEAILDRNTIFYTDQERQPIYQENKFFSDIIKGDEATRSPAQFAVVDLDGDGVPEVVFQRSDYRGFIILRHQKSGVYGYEINYRSLMELKKDGSYSMSSGAADNAVGKMRFLGNFFDSDTRLHSLGQQDRRYYSHGKSIDRDAFDQAWQTYAEQPNVDWHEYSDSSVAQLLEHDLNLMNISAPAERQSAEMQSYLDSLSDLLYFNCYPGSSATSADWDASYVRYVDGWNQAMDTIYTLCVKELPQNGMDFLIAEQQQWLETRNQTGAAELSQLGDMTKMRTYHLISLYFGDHFYN